MNGRKTGVDREEEPSYRLGLGRSLSTLLGRPDVSSDILWLR